jgi:hypothetical protein
MMNKSGLGSNVDPSIAQQKILDPSFEAGI